MICGSAWTIAGSATGLTYSISGLPAGATATISGTTASITGLARSTTYTLGVMATANGQSGGVGTVTFTTQSGVVVPTAPTGLAMTAATTSSITVGWVPPVTGPAATYTVQYATNAGFTTGLVTTTGVATTAFTASGLTANTTYYFRVMSVNSAAIVATGKVKDGGFVGDIVAARDHYLRRISR